MAEDEKKPVETKPIRPISIPFEIKTVYSNGGNVGLTQTELQLTATLNGRPAVMLVMPFPAAKSVALAMIQAIKDYESHTNTKVLDLREIAELFKK